MNSSMKSIIVRVKHHGENIRHFSTTYPNLISGVINKEKYSNIIKTLNGFNSIYNYKPMIYFSALLMLGFACCIIGGVATLFLMPKHDDNDYSHEVDSPPVSIFISQTLLFSAGGLMILNSFFFFFTNIKERPTSNIRIIKDAITNFNVEYLSKQITFSLDYDDEKDKYFLKIIFPNSPVIDQTGFNEVSPLLKQKSGYMKLQLDKSNENNNENKAYNGNNGNNGNSGNSGNSGKNNNVLVYDPNKSSDEEGDAEDILNNK